MFGRVEVWILIFQKMTFTENDDGSEIKTCITRERCIIGIFGGGTGCRGQNRNQREKSLPTVKNKNKSLKFDPNKNKSCQKWAGNRAGENGAGH